MCENMKKGSYNNSNINTIVIEQIELLLLLVSLCSQVSLEKASQK